MNRICRVAWFSLFVVVAVSSSCAEPSRTEDYRLNESMSEDVLSELRSRQFITYRIGAGDPVSVSLADSTNIASLPSDFQTAIGNECRLRLWRATTGRSENDTSIPPSDVFTGQYTANSSYCTPGVSGPYAGSFCTTQGLNCELHLLMDMVQRPGSTSLVWSWNAANGRVNMVVDVLGTAEAAALAESAVARHSMTVANQAYYLGANFLQSCVNCTTIFSATPSQPTTLAQAAPATLGIYYNALRDAVRVARDKYSALADEVAASTVDRSRASLRAMAIRALGASVVRGYSHTQRPPNPTDKLLAMEFDSRPAVRRARELIRETAPPPSEIFALENDPRNAVAGFAAAGTSLNTVLTTIRNNYNIIHGSSLSTSTELYARVGTDENAFKQARSELADRFFVFRRSTRQQLPSRTTPPLTNIYASSGTDAEVPDEDWPIFSSVLERPNAQNRGLSHAAYWIVTYYRQFVTQSSPTAAVVTARSEMKAVRDIAYGDAPGTVTVSMATSPVTVDVYFEGRSTAKDVLIIADANPHISAELVRCAVQGEIEGQTCSSGILLNTNADMPGTQDSEGRSLARRTGLPTGKPIYVLVRRPGWAPDASVIRPGAYMPVFSGITPSVAGGVNEGTYYLDPETEEMAGRMMMPSWLGGQPAISCANIDSGEAPMVLENVATATQNGEEDSWRQYLTLARQAADEADLLGEQALNATFEANTQAEGALQDLQQLCGVSVSLDTLRTLVPAGTDPVLALSTVPALADSTDPDIRKLRACVSTDAASVQSHVSLGSQKVCLWTLDGNPDRLCELAPGETNTSLACPRLYDPGSDNVATTDGGCRVPNASNPAYRAVLLDQDRELLRYISELSDADTTPTANNSQQTDSCNGLRQFLAGVDSWASNGTLTSVLETLHASNVRAARYLDPVRAAELARGIRWEAQLGGYAKLYVNDRLLYSTGSASTGPAQSGLCLGGNNTVVPASECPAGNNSLLCSRVDCTGSGRLDLNRRMLGAAIVARWLGGQMLNEFVVPSVDRTHDTSSTWNAYPLIGTTMMYMEEGGARHWCEVWPSGASAGTFKAWDWGIPGMTESFFTNCNPAIFPGTDLVFHTLTDSEALDVGVAASPEWSDTEYQGALQFLRNITAGSGVTTGLSATAFTQAANHQDSQAVYHLPTGFTGDAQARHDFPVWFPCHSSFMETFCWTPQLVPSASAVYYDILHASSGGRDIRGQTVHDALELLCEADRNVASAEPGCGDTPTGLDASDLNVAASQVRCVADRVRRQASLAVFTNIPNVAVDAMRQDDPLGTQTRAGGDFVQAAIRMRIAMQSVARANDQVSFHAGSLSRAIRDTNQRLRILNLQMDSQRLAMNSAIVAQSAACAAAIKQIKSPLGIASAAVACGAAAAQIGFVVKQFRNQRGINDSEEARALIALEQAAADRGEGINAAGARILESQEEIDAAAHSIDRIRQRSQQLMRTALYVSGSNIAPVMATHIASRQRNNTANVRYQRALRNAVRLSDLARRAIEQRFAVRLADIEQDMQFVEAPALWSSRLCATTGIDYGRIVANGAVNVNADYADQYIGDYVRNLEQFVVSYGFAYPSTSGSDVAVISLRDDVLQVRDTCDVSMNNVLAQSNEVGASAVVSSDGAQVAAGWERFGCAPDGTASAGVRIINCVLADPLVETWPDIDPSAIGVPKPFRITFGAGASGVCENAQCSWQPGATLGQRVSLTPGTYRVSWYGRAVAGSTAMASRAVRIVKADSPSTVLLDSATPSSAVLGSWTRYWFIGTVPQSDARVEIINYGGGFNHKVDVAGLMVERIEGTASVQPPQFISTYASRTAAIEACEDTDGDKFRAGWKRECEPIFVNGVRLEGQVRCYRKIMFTVSDAAMESGQIFRASGFASGNFNYRSTTLGVNVVGSAARQCVDPALPSTCYSAGFIPYTLVHAGPYPVRSYDTTTFAANLYPAQIYNARALAAERYITNPISSADQALLSQYMRNEYSGRPLTGTYELRIYEESGVNFFGIEDVQLVLGYEYWTRSQQLH